ncbi:hypothetical protein EON63_13485 [archaeon]|nr:MAG: hypothetical protein EON63_13485 [archaeon]
MHHMDFLFQYFTVCVWKSTDGTLINTGENIYSVLYKLTTTSSSEDASDTNDLSIFFDVLNIYTVTVTEGHIPFMFLCVVCIGIATVAYMLQVSRQSVYGLLYGVYIETSLFISTLLVGSGVGVVAFLLYPMRWYDGGMVVSFLVFLPPLVLYTLYTRGVYAEAYPLHTKLLQQLSLLCVWICLVSLCMCFNIMSGYLGCIWIVCISASVWVYYFCMYYHLHRVIQGSKDGDDVFTQCQTHLLTNTSCQARYHVYYLLCLFPALCMCIKTINATMVMLIPLLGKTGTVAPSDIALGANFALHITMPLGSLLANFISKRLTKTQVSMFGYGILASVVVLVCVNRSYSAEHPKRLWLQQVERHYRHVGGTSRWLPPHIQQKKQSNDQVVSDYGVWVNGFDERGLDPIMPYIYSYYDAPQSHSMFVQSKANSYVVDVYSYLEGLYRSYVKQDLYLEKNSDCSFLSSSCYYQFPWYFPVPDALRYGLYLPLHPSPHHTAVAGSVAATPFHSIPVDNKMQFVLQSYALGTNVLTGAQQHVQKCSSYVANSTYRVVQIDIYGPAHMNIGLKTDSRHADGIVAWWLDDLSVLGQQPGDDSNRLTRQLEDVVSSMECSSRIRGDGLHYFHVGTGRCDLTDNNRSDMVLLCTHRRLYVLASTQTVEVVAYGHYADMSDDVQVQGLVKALPVWSQGAEWTKFPSVLISDVV